ncbi:MAG: hypothetical protein JO138_11415 [Acidobacteriaceae bacterium]|nr:hypothetical protein [Acidobacteriaceae bacterium]
MSALDLTLGITEVARGAPKAYAPKPPASSPANRVAVLVAHGMGQQVPYETIDGVVQALVRDVEASRADITSAVIRTVRMGAQNLDELEPELVRAEFEIAEENGNRHEVHVYEAYWAPLTEGKITAAEVVKFLFDAGWNGIKNTEGKTYQRWMFGRERNFELRTERLVAAFVGIMALLASLVFINAVAAAAAASHAIGTARPFPTGTLLVQLTWDFVIVDIAAALIAAGVFGFGNASSPAVRRLGWVVIFLGAFMIVLGAIFMAGHLAGVALSAHMVPRDGWERIVTCFPLAVLALWAVEFWATLKARALLVQYVGDVAAYIAAHTVSKFWAAGGL